MKSDIITAKNITESKSSIVLSQTNDITIPIKAKGYYGDFNESFSICISYSLSTKISNLIKKITKYINKNIIQKYIILMKLIESHLLINILILIKLLQNIGSIIYMKIRYTHKMNKKYNM